MKKYINLFRFYLWRIIEKVCHRFNIFCFVFTSQGLKNINISSLASYKLSENKDIVELNPKDLFLGADFLRDEYSLINISVDMSPHKTFQQCILEGNDISKTDYLIRYVSGKLDWRRIGKINKNNDRYIRATKRTKCNILKGDYPPVIVYCLSERYYIYDGKHRASMCALLGRNVKCQIVDASIAFCNHWDYMFKLVCHKKNYKKHASLYLQYLNQENGQK